MKVKNLTRLTITLSTLCLASTLFCSVNAHTALKKGCEYASITHPLGAEMTMVGKPMVCTYAVLPNGKTGYRWVSSHSAVYKVALTKPLKESAIVLPAGAHVGAALNADNNVDTYIHNIHAKFKAVRDADNALGMEMQTSSANHVRLLKNIMQNSSLYEFNLGVQTVSPKLSRVLNSTLAFYQRQRTNILLAALVAKQHEVTTNATVPFSTGKNSLLLHVHGKTIPFFQFVHDFHAQNYVHECMIPLIRHGDITLQQLHLTKHIFGVLASHGDDNSLFHLRHCRSRSEKWYTHLYGSNVYAVHDAALLTAANHTVLNQYNLMRVNPALATRLHQALLIALLHPTLKNVGAYLKMQQQANTVVNNRLKNTEAYISQHNMQSNDAALSVGCGAFTPAFSIDDFGKNLHAVAQAMHDEDTGLSASKKTGNVSTSAGNGGITVFPGDFNISEKELIKAAKDALSEASNIFPTKTNSNVNHDEALGKAFASLGYSNNETSREVYKGQAAGYYSDGKPISELNIPVPTVITGNGGIDLYAVQQKAGQTA